MTSEELVELIQKLSECTDCPPMHTGARLKWDAANAIRQLAAEVPCQFCNYGHTGQERVWQEDDDTCRRCNGTGRKYHELSGNPGQLEGDK